MDCDGSSGGRHSSGGFEMTITRPETISQDWWDALTENEREFVAENEKVNAEFRETLRKVRDQIIEEQGQ